MRPPRSVPLTELEEWPRSHSNHSIFACLDERNTKAEFNPLCNHSNVVDCVDGHYSPISFTMTVAGRRERWVLI